MSEEKGGIHFFKTTIIGGLLFLVPVVVMTPSPPNPRSGMVHVVEADRLQRLELPITTSMENVERFGQGTNELLQNRYHRLNPIPDLMARDRISRQLRQAVRNSGALDWIKGTGEFLGGRTMRPTTYPAPALRGSTLALIALLTFAALPVAAEEEYFQPKPPMPEKFDWIQMDSLEWLKGEFISLYDDSVEFDSIEFDMQTVDWSDVKELRSVGIMQVAFEDGTIAVGRLLIDSETVRIMGDEDQTFPRAGVLSITAGAPKEKNYWSVKASIGANIRDGNTEQVETTGKAHIVRRTPRNRINFDLLSTYNRTFGDVAADNQRATAGWNHYFTKRFYWTPVYGEWYRDPFVNIDQRWTLGMGAGYEIIDTSKITWDANGGLAYQTTSFVSVAAGDDDTANTPALVIGTAYDQEITKWMDFLVNYRLMVVNELSGTFTHHFETGLELEITRLFDFDITLIWDRVQNPRPESDGVVPKQDDFRLVFFLGFDF